MICLERVGLTPLMALGEGDPDLTIALLDGPVSVGHPALAGASIMNVREHTAGCRQAASAACAHGTFVAGVLVADRSASAPAICPRCSLLVRPIFGEAGENAWLPLTTVAQLAQAIVECVDAGARVLNLSASAAAPSTEDDGALRASLDHAVRRGALVVAAAGNQGTLGSSAITRHPGVIAVAACDADGRPIAMTNLGGSTGRRGLSAVGAAVESLGTQGATLTLSGTSFATPFVTGAIALLWSLFPHASAGQIRHALTGAARRISVVPPLLDAWTAFQRLAKSLGRPVVMTP